MCYAVHVQGGNPEKKLTSVIPTFSIVRKEDGFQDSVRPIKLLDSFLPIIYCENLVSFTVASNAYKLNDK